MRKVTVGDLISILKLLPADALVYRSAWNADEPLDRSDLVSPYCTSPLSVYERAGEVRLYFDDGEATHPDIDPFRNSIFLSSGALGRIMTSQANRFDGFRQSNKRYFLRESVVNFPKDDPELWNKFWGGHVELFLFNEENLIQDQSPTIGDEKLVEIEWWLK